MTKSLSLKFQTCNGRKLIHCSKLILSLTKTSFFLIKSSVKLSNGGSQTTHIAWDNAYTIAWLVGLNISNGFAKQHKMSLWLLAV